MGWSAWLRATMPAGDTMTFHDAAAGTHRAAVLQNGRLETLVFVAAGPKLPSP